MILFGLLGFTHGWAATLTVMCPLGASYALDRVAAGDDVITRSNEGQLTHYLEKRRGALDRLIECHRIAVLSKPQWDAKKAELGDIIYT